MGRPAGMVPRVEMTVAAEAPVVRARSAQRVWMVWSAEAWMGTPAVARV